jgi:uncharacterized membrane protein (Fun14 family)
VLFFFRGRHATVAKAAIGVVLLVVGLLIHGGDVLAAIGAALIVWSAVSGLTGLRSRHEDGGQ